MYVCVCVYTYISPLKIMRLCKSVKMRYWLYVHNICILVPPGLCEHVKKLASGSLTHNLAFKA